MILLNARQERKKLTTHKTHQFFVSLSLFICFIILSTLDSKADHCIYVQRLLLLCPAHTLSDSTTQTYMSLFAPGKSWYRTHGYSKDSGKNSARHHLARIGGPVSQEPLSLDQGYRSLETRSRIPDHHRTDYRGPCRHLLTLLSCFL